MPTTLTNKKSTHGSRDNWEKQEQAITHNDVIDAYLKGKEEGKAEGRKDGHNEIQMGMKTLFANNLTKAKEICEILFERIKEMGYKPESVHLKADLITEFLALIVINKDAYVKDGIGEVFSIARQYKDAHESESFNISFTFTYAADTLNYNCLVSDGYFLKYGH